MRSDQRGLTMIELMLVVVIVGLLSSIALPLYADALSDSRRLAFLADCRELMSAMTRYHTDEGKYPSEKELNLQTLEPLSSRGYFNNAEAWLNKLQDGQLRGYLAPDDLGSDTEFLMFFVTAFDEPTGVFLWESDFGDGQWRSGIYVSSRSSLIPVDEAW